VGRPTTSFQVVNLVFISCRYWEIGTNRGCDLMSQPRFVPISGWHEVVRVNKMTVTVDTGYSWTNWIPHDRIVEVRRG
jgi:hypothetical protein